MPEQDLKNMKTGEVAEEARKAGVSDPDTMNKQEMIDAIRGQAQAPADDAEDVHAEDDEARDVGIKVHDPTSREQDKDYDQSDLEHVLRVRSWGGYEELIRWLRENGDDDNELTPGEVRHLVQDLTRLRDGDADFETDPERLFQQLKH